MLQAGIDEVMEIRRALGETEDAREQFAWSERDDVYHRGV
jgi:hypothetical protein